MDRWKFLEVQSSSREEKQGDLICDAKVENTQIGTIR